MSPEPEPKIDLRPAAGPDAAAGDRAAAMGERLRSAFEEACARENVRGRLVGPPYRMAFTFETQETAPPELILEAFLRELEARGVLAGPGIAPRGKLGDAEVEAVADALRDSVRRLRALMIEYNSYLSAGLPWVFPAAIEPLGSRGLCVYRYPARAEVDVTAVENAIRIAFPPGPLGEATSSGFYVPTSVRGDFTATIRYRIRRWRPGPVNSCLALFAQDEPSMVRYYSQRYTEAGAPEQPLVQANLTDTRSPAVPVTGNEGAFRLERRGAALSAWHDAGAGWQVLADTACDPATDLYFGSKIWSGGECGGLEADLFDLVIEGAIPGEQSIALVTRPDPRRG